MALLIQISKDEKWHIYLLRVTGCPNHGTWAKSCKAMDPSTDLIIYVIYFKMFRFFSLPRSLFGKIFFFHFTRVWWAKRPKRRLLENSLSMSPSGKRKKQKKNARLLIGRIIFLTCEKSDKCHLIGSSVLRPAWKWKSISRLLSVKILVLSSNLFYSTYIKHRSNPSNPLSSVEYIKL